MTTEPVKTKRLSTGATAQRHNWSCRTPIAEEIREGSTRDHGAHRLRRQMKIPERYLKMREFMANAGIDVTNDHFRRLLTR